MALHELATNAGKYEALSTDTGHVDIVWRLERAGAGGRRFSMEWSENGGPTVVAPTRRGFGWSVLCSADEGVPRSGRDTGVCAHRGGLAPWMPR